MEKHPEDIRSGVSRDMKPIIGAIFTPNPELRQELEQILADANLSIHEYCRLARDSRRVAFSGAERDFLAHRRNRFRVVAAAEDGGA